LVVSLIQTVPDVKSKISRAEIEQYPKLNEKWNLRLFHFGPKITSWISILTILPNYDWAIT
jgi:hypothetical protein